MAFRLLNLILFVVLAAQLVMAQVAVVPDNPSPRVSALKEIGGVGANDKIIFGTGDQRGSITLTGDGRFVRAARGQGVELRVIVHKEARFKRR